MKSDIAGVKVEKCSLFCYHVDMNKTVTKEKMVQIPKIEYDLLYSAHKNFRIHTMIMRALDAEKNYRENRVKMETLTSFLKRV